MLDDTLDVKTCLRFLFCSRFYFFGVFYSFNVFIYKKTLTKRYANDEKHLLATATKPRHLDS